ncbi:MAG TPA: amidohydrolase family protein [Acidimicrobiales bacterium]|nr:amidohydrolase family protein [Acidimicrobiales bacterium]
MTDVLPYQILDADNHFNEPPDCYERYIDPARRDLAVRWVEGPDGGRVQLFAGRPSKFHSDQVTFSKDVLEKMLGQLPADPTMSSRDPDTEKRVLPGMLLNRLNPLKGLSDEQRAEFIAEFRGLSEAYGNREVRLALMDDQGIEAALMFPASAHDIEFEFADNVEAMYANIRAFNRWMHEEIGYAYQGRMFLPPYVALADVDLAVAELEILLDTGAPIIQIKAGHAHGGRANPFGGRSVADPVFDPFWSRVNEAGVRVAVHLGGTDYQKYGADWSEDPAAVFGDFDAFQWVMYWGDRPAQELAAGLVLHNFFGRFPNIRVCLSEQGTVWLPYTLRKMDHAYLMGRKAKWGELEDRPSAVFKRHFIVAPFPEENVRRVVDEVGIEPIVFGSDFPHGEGLARPHEYVGAQLGGFGPDEQRRIMRDNLASFLGMTA